VVSELVFGFRGMPLLLRVWLSLDRSSLSWVCDKIGFSGSFCNGDLSLERGMTSSSRIEIENFNGKNYSTLPRRFGVVECLKRIYDQGTMG